MKRVKRLSGAAALQAWITKQGLSQAEASWRLHVTPSMLNHILAGRRAPGLRSAVRIQRATGIAVEIWVAPDFDQVAS